MQSSKRDVKHRSWLDALKTAELALALLGLAVGVALELMDLDRVGRWVLMAATAMVLASTLASVVHALAHREVGVDLIAALALGGALVLGEYLAGAIIAVMLVGGAALERFAAARARRELTALLRRAPRVVHRLEDGKLRDISAEDATLGDLLLIKPGEVVPADGVLTSTAAVLDEAALTGESRPSNIVRGELVRSGGSNVGEPFELRVTVAPSESTYAGIIRLVAEAERSRAPLVRLADRYALGFLGLTILLAGLAWAISGSPTRALAVLVVATPCPLIIAAPVAVIAGISSAARSGVIVKGGGALETLARARVLLLDKTGTLTTGRPQVASIEVFDGSSDSLVWLAASLEQASIHPFAPAILAEARGRGQDLEFPTEIHEQMGAGITGMVGSRRVTLGQLEFVAPNAPRTSALRSLAVRTAVEGSASVFVSVDGDLIGALLIHDPIRADAPRTLAALRKAGIARIHMVTGDSPDVADLVGDAVGVDRVFAERTPEDKLEVVKLVRAEGVTVMVGDGINDAPALALADVGVAMGARGASAASEAADVVLTRDRLDGLCTALAIARRTRRIAVGSIAGGIGLSLAAMVAAALGYLSPAIGAMLQEVIDLLAIANSLRALGQPGPRRKIRVVQRELARKLATAHRNLRPRLFELLELASQLDELSPSDARARLVSTHEMLAGELLAHEQAEQREAFPVIEKLLDQEDPTGPLIRTHQEIRRLVRLFGRLVEQLPAEGPGPEDLRDLHRLLYGLHAILSLHFAQEDELYSYLDT